MFGLPPGRVSTLGAHAVKTVAININTIKIRFIIAII
jgi:hypothetical protein